MSIGLKIIGAGVRKPLTPQVVKIAEQAVNPILQKGQRTFCSALLKGIRGDIAIFSRGRGVDSPTLFARLGKDGSLQPLKTKQLCKPFKLDNGNILRRRFDYSFTEISDGQKVKKTIRNDRLYNIDGLMSKSRSVTYYAPNAVNGHYTRRLPYPQRVEYDIANGKYSKNIEATNRSGRIVGEEGTLTYKNGHISTERKSLYSYNPNLKG